MSLQWTDLEGWDFLAALDDVLAGPQEYALSDHIVDTLGLGGHFAACQSVGLRLSHLRKRGLVIGERDDCHGFTRWRLTRKGRRALAAGPPPLPRGA